MKLPVFAKKNWRKKKKKMTSMPLPEGIGELDLEE